jgi:hypothetical protein
MKLMPDLTTIVRLLTAHRFRWSNEAELQMGIAQVLAEAGISHEREAVLSGAGRIDFLLADGLGLEVKVDGAPAEVARQILAYAHHPRITALIVVTARAGTASLLPASSGGKEIHVVSLWRGAFA